MTQRVPGAALLKHITCGQGINKYLLNICNVPGSVLSDGDLDINKMDMLSDHGASLLVAKT